MPLEFLRLCDYIQTLKLCKIDLFTKNKKYSNAQVLFNATKSEHFVFTKLIEFLRQMLPQHANYFEVVESGILFNPCM